MAANGWSPDLTLLKTGTPLPPITAGKGYEKTVEGGSLQVSAYGQRNLTDAYFDTALGDARIRPYDTLLSEELESTDQDAELDQISEQDLRIEYLVIPQPSESHRLFEVDLALTAIFLAAGSRHWWRTTQKLVNPSVFVTVSGSIAGVLYYVRAATGDLIQIDSDSAGNINMSSTVSAHHRMRLRAITASTYDFSAKYWVRS